MKYAFDLNDVEKFEKQFYLLRENIMKSNKVFNVYRKTPTERVLHDNFIVLSRNIEEFSRSLCDYLNEVYAYNSSINKDYSSLVMRTYGS